jgi:hypothetical protein
MLFEQRFRICQESEYAGGRGMRTGDHCRSCVVCRLRVRVHLTFPSKVYTRLLPKLRPRSSLSRPISCEPHPNKCLSLLSLVALPGVQLPAQPAPSSSTLLPKSGPQNAKPSSITPKVRDVLPASPEVEDSSDLSPDTTDLWRKISYYGCLPASKWYFTRAKNEI